MVTMCRLRLGCQEKSEESGGRVPELGKERDSPLRQGMHEDRLMYPPHRL